MGLTSLTFLMVIAVVTIGAAAALVVVWRRLRGRLMATRVAGILLCEVLLLVTAAVGINRWGDFYPNWSALTGDAAALVSAAPATIGGKSVSPYAGRVGTIRWASAAIASLGVQPVVWIPRPTVGRPDRLLPVVVVLATADATVAEGAWNGNDIRGLSAGAPGCVVFLRISGRTNIGVLATVLPSRLSSDFRVTAHSWVVIGIGRVAATAGQLLAVAPKTFGRLVRLTAASAAASLKNALAAAFAAQPPPLAPPEVIPPLVAPAVSPGLNPGLSPT